jgi:hypothetical protein
VLRLQWRVNQAHAGAVVKVDHVVEGRRLKGAAEIDEHLAVIIYFVQASRF